MQKGVFIKLCGNKTSIERMLHILYSENTSLLTSFLKLEIWWSKYLIQDEFKMSFAKLKAHYKIVFISLCKFVPPLIMLSYDVLSRVLTTTRRRTTTMSLVDSDSRCKNLPP
jgi:hypothetical protein